MTSRVGITILLRDQLLFRCIFVGFYEIVIPTGAQRSGGTCGFFASRNQFNLSHPSPLVIPSVAEVSAVRPAALSNPSWEAAPDEPSPTNQGLC
jgi:hypothetical protein